MKALQWDSQKLSLREIPKPQRASGEALVKVLRAGICNTDLEIMRGYHGFSGTLGHEFVGLVEEAEDETLRGRRVVADINFACGDCAMCRRGLPHHCLNRGTLGIIGRDGAFADYLCCPEDNLVVLPDTLAEERAVFAEPVAAALEILEQVDCRALEEAAVVGDGKLGLLVAMSLAGAGLRVSLLGRHPQKGALVEDYGVRFLSARPARQFALVVEASGNPAGFHDALALTEPCGTIVLKSTYAGGFDFNPAPLVVNEITLLGSRCGPMPRAVELLAAGDIRPERLVEAEYALQDGPRAVEHAARKGTLKILLRPEAG